MSDLPGVPGPSHHSLIPQAPKRCLTAPVWVWHNDSLVKPMPGMWVPQVIDLDIVHAVRPYSIFETDSEGLEPGIYEDRTFLSMRRGETRVHMPYRRVSALFEAWKEYQAAVSRLRN